MKEINHITESEKDKISHALHELYDPNSVGQIEKYPPHGEYFVSLYFDAEFYSIKVTNRYNHPIGENEDRFLCDFELSNMNKVGNELNITVKITKQ